MIPLFGTDGLITHLTLIFGALYALGGFMFRKVVANDMLDRPFSFIGCMLGSMLVFMIIDNIFHIIKLSVVLSLLGWLAGGFLLGPLLPDGESSE